MSKLVIVTAPSGAGKTTIVRHLLSTFDNLVFSVSATTRSKRDYEVDGKDYYFISQADFRAHIAAGDFLEWEEVYENQFYGTLKSEVSRIWDAQLHIIFDIDVKGALNIKNAYPQDSLAIFVKPPSPEVLFQRLIGRQTENAESLKKRLARAEEELGYENKFDHILVNDTLEHALEESERVVREFLNATPWKP
jgi:guanylate kinase